MHYFFQPITHIRIIQRWVKAHSAKCTFDVETFRATVIHQNRRLTLIPRFLVQTQNGSAYTSQFGNSGMFVGWLPYELKRWPIASDKLKFKNYCENTRLPIPAYWTDEQPTNDFIVKGRQGSFGQGIRGPYRPDQFESIKGSFAPGEYCEQFIDGDSLKIWFWNSRPIVVERLPQRYLIGDGKKTIAEIMAGVRGSFDKQYEADDFSKGMMSWQGYTVDDVPAHGQRVMLDYRYASPFDPIFINNRDVMSTQTEAVKNFLSRVGDALSDAIPKEIRSHVMFTVDAMADSENKIWLLEMNSHPMIHPQSYSSIFDDMLVGEIHAV